MISMKLIGGPELVARFEQASPAVRTTLERGMARALLRLLIKVKDDKLSGGALHVRTGRLRRSIHQEMAWTSPNKLMGLVGTNVAYARVHEYGFTGTVTVRDHLRRLKGNTVRARLKKLNAMGLRGMTTVEAHKMKMHVPERSFLRSALDELKTQLRDDLEGGIGHALKQ
jgi:phage gpG-like protein